MTDEVDGFPEPQGGVDLQEPEGHAEVGEPLEANEPADPVVDPDAAVPLVLNKFLPQNFVEQIFDRLRKIKICYSTFWNRQLYCMLTSKLMLRKSKYLDIFYENANVCVWSSAFECMKLKTH